MAMIDEIDLVAASPADFTFYERRRFEELVVQAGEVADAALTTNTINARVLVMMKHHGMVRGVSALKRPQESYRKKIVEQTEIELPTSDYPYELGYIFIKPELQGLGLSHRLVSEALAYSDNEGVFATVRTDNGAMRTALYRAGFVDAGKTYQGFRERTIGLLLRDKALFSRSKP